jgi:hypothetical protein
VESEGASVAQWEPGDQSLRRKKKKSQKRCITSCNCKGYAIIN